MKFSIRFFSFILAAGVVGLSGCGFFKGKDSASSEPRDRVVTVVQPHRLEEGGRLLVVPFWAGVGVMASDDLDRVSLRIVKGIVDGLQETGAPFEILVAQNADAAQLKIEGQITQKRIPSRVKSWIGGRKVLSAEGELVDAKTGRTILRFVHTVVSQSDEESFEDLGISLGREIGERIAAKSRPS